MNWEVTGQVTLWSDTFDGQCIFLILSSARDVGWAGWGLEGGGEQKTKHEHNYYCNRCWVLYQLKLVLIAVCVEVHQ